ncbi:MAG: hypothetical protein WDW36_004044 [Sanguina aurantia]
MGAGGEPPFLTSCCTLFMMGLLFLLGRIRDLLATLTGHTFDSTKKGYAPVKDQGDDFYRRRLYKRMVDCWNRPICSAPDAWIDVLERTDIEGSSGLHQDELELTGTSRRCLNLGSYNYLGFAASDVYCTPRVIETLDEYGVSSCSTRGAGGTTAVHVALEEMLTGFLGVDAVLTFGMGFATNSATIPALVGKGCLILSDALNHVSIVAGSKVSGAKVKVFRHNDARHLESILRNSIAEGQPRTGRAWRKIMIIVEGIYSMEGELCALREIVAVKKKYRVLLYLDEAHSIGALGRTGRGVCEHTGVDPREVDIMMGTFTKSFGSCGGYIGGSKELVGYLKRHCPAHLYATAMAPAATQQVLSALKLLLGHDGTDRGQRKVAQLHENANYFRARLIDQGLDVLGDFDSPIMPIMMYHAGKIPAFSRGCYDQHLAMVVVGFPATALLLTRARVCISASHCREDLDYALEVGAGDGGQACTAQPSPNSLQRGLAGERHLLAGIPMLAPVISIPRTASPCKAKAMQPHHSASPDAIKHTSDQAHESFKRSVADAVADVNGKHVLSPAHPAAPATPNRRRANGAKRAIGPEFRTAVHTITA